MSVWIILFCFLLPQGWRKIARKPTNSSTGDRVKAYHINQGVQLQLRSIHFSTPTPACVKADVMDDLQEASFKVLKAHFRGAIMKEMESNCSHLKEKARKWKGIKRTQIFKEDGYFFSPHKSNYWRALWCKAMRYLSYIVVRLRFSFEIYLVCCQQILAYKETYRRFCRKRSPGRCRTPVVERRMMSNL